MGATDAPDCPLQYCVSIVWDATRAGQVPECRQNETPVPGRFPSLLMVISIAEREFTLRIVCRAAPSARIFGF